MSEERSQFAQRIDEKKFSLNRKGYDKREVRDYLEDLEQAFRELEGHAKRTSQRVGELERDLSKARATERVSVDNAMMAVFDAKDRILERARRKADEIEEEAHAEAGRIKAAAITGSGGADGVGGGELEAARAQADEIVAAARREADRLRRDMQTDAAADLEAELAAASAQLRRAHADTASAREELDAARKRIVELESGEEGSGSGDLEHRFAELESHLNAAKSDIEHLEGELEARDHQVGALQAAVTAADGALGESKSYVATVEAEMEMQTGRVAELDAEVDRLSREIKDAKPSDEDFAIRMREIEAALSVSSEREDQADLVDELLKTTAVAERDAERIAELEASLSAHEQRLAEAEETITELRSDEASAADKEEAAAIIIAAREEAEAITADAEEEAEQRAAKVIAKAREEADQVRQTVQTLTAQAEDARSAAIRSKLEAEDLAETQRSIGQARDDIVAVAESRAREIEDEAQRAATAAQQQADATLAEAAEKAEQLRAESEQRAASILAEAEEQAGVVRGSASEVESGEAGTDADELAAMLAEAEQEVALSEELRRQRGELEAREQELVERERQLHDKHAETAKIFVSNRDNQIQVPQAPVEFVSDDDPIAAVEEPAAEPVAEAPAEELAERLSSLLEQAVSPSAVEEAGEEVDLNLVDSHPDEEPRPRMAWPTPVREDTEVDAGTPADDADDDDAGEARESRYRSRSAQLPRLGSQAKSNMTTMANLRKKSRGSND